MKITDFKDELKQLIAQGNNELVLEKLMAIAKSQGSDVSNMIYSLSAGYTKYKKDLNFGILSEEKTKEFRNELTYRLLHIVDDLEELDKTDEEADKIEGPKPTEPKVESITPTVEETIAPTPSKRKFLKWMLPLLGIFVIGFAFKFFQPKAPERAKLPKVNWVDVWQGEWKHKLYPTKNSKEITTGYIRFKQKGNELIGAGVFIYPTAGSAKVRLSDIRIKNNIITGNWKSELVDPTNPQRGKFEFRLNKNNKTFTGTYNLMKNEQLKYNWNGRKE